MIRQLCDNSSEDAFRQHLTISVHNSLRRWPCPLQARELLSGTDSIQDVGRHLDFFLHTFGWLLSPRYMFLQLMNQHTGLVAWFSLSSQLVQCDHPTPWEGFRAFLAIQSTCKYDQVLVHLLQYLHLVDLVGCQPESSWLLYPVLQNVSGVSIVVR